MSKVGKSARLFAAVLVMAAMAGEAAAVTAPQQLAAFAVGDPKSETPDCVAARADADAWDEQRGKSAFKTVGRIIIWPLGERSARRGKRAKNEARQLVTDRVREACFTIPELARAAPIPGQRRPMGQGYRGGVAFLTGAGGVTVKGQVHPTLNTIYLAAVNGVVGGTAEDWAGLAGKVISPAGCQIADAWPGPAKAWEVSYVCPEGVDLIQLFNEQSERVRVGAPLQLRR